MSSKPAIRPRSPSRPHPPSVEAVLKLLRPSVDALDPDAVAAAARDVIASERSSLAAGGDPRDTAQLAQAARTRLESFDEAGLTPVINATGVIVHTNLGRAPWPSTVATAAARAAQEPILLELDRETGRRGARARIAEDHLVALTGAEDALVTNNNAAALALAVGLAGRGGVVVSRGELVEIGGGVRIPEIIRRAGAKLIEVGTTNRTRTTDFAPPLAEGRARAVLRVHPSNFAMTGFTETPDQREVSDLAHRHGAIVIDDLGSGALLDTAAFGLTHEPLPVERLAAGSDIVTFSGDKLVGGPQAGLIVGRADLIARLRRDPLARAMRPDKTTMAGIAVTLGLYRSGRALADIPVWRMIATPVEELRDRAAALVAHLGGETQAIDVHSTVGGGSLPGQTLPSVGIALRSPSPSRTLASLRRGTPAVIGRIDEGRVILDLRTVAPDADERLEDAVRTVLR